MLPDDEVGVWQEFVGAETGGRVADQIKRRVNFICISSRANVIGGQNNAAIPPQCFRQEIVRRRLARVGISESDIENHGASASVGQPVNQASVKGAVPGPIERLPQFFIRKLIHIDDDGLIGSHIAPSNNEEVVTDLLQAGAQSKLVQEKPTRYSQQRAQGPGKMDASEFKREIQKLNLKLTVNMRSRGSSLYKVSGLSL